MKISKKIIRFLLDEYIEDCDKPSSQIDNRFTECFDKQSIMDEIYAHLKNNLFEDLTELRKKVRDIVRLAEEHANWYKRVKVVSEDVAYYFSIVG